MLSGATHLTTANRCHPVRNSPSVGGPNDVRSLTYWRSSHESKTIRRDSGCPWTRNPAGSRHRGAPEDPPKTLWVSPAAVSATPDSCSKPGYNTIQSAINVAPAGATIRVCAGTCVEQLQIIQAVSLVGVGAVTVQLPAVPANSTTACDTAPGTGAFQPNQDGVAVCTTGVVNITGLKINAAWPSFTCDDSLYGVLVAGGATVNLTNSSIVAAGAVPLNGCQGGVGIQVGMAWTTPVEVGHANLSNDSISGYQKNGVTVDGAGSSANVARTTVTGIGPTTQIAQNGIQVSNGASARISSSTISSDECNVAVCGANALTQTQSVGVLFFGAASDSSVTSSKINGNDIGVYNYETTVPHRAGRFGGRRHVGQQPLRGRGARPGLGVGPR
jgi:hypothetical protein